MSRVLSFFVRCGTKLRCCKSGKKVALWDRARGEYMRPWDQVEEPARTERLLANPFVFYRDNTADAIDALKLFLMNRASGFSFMGVSYDFFCIMAQLTVALLYAVGANIENGSDAAGVQLLCVLSVQWFTSLYIIGAQPSIDRIDALINSAQFGVEGGMTFCFCMLHFNGPDIDPDLAGGLQGLAFALGLVAMMLPISEKVYDAFIVQISKIMRKDDFSWASCGFAMIAFLLQLPALIAGLVGLDLGSGDMEGALDELNTAAEASMDDIAEGLAGMAGASNMFSNLAWMNNPLPKHHRAAVKLQRFRQARVLKEKAKKHRAAARIQARYRGRSVRSEYDTMLDSIPPEVMNMRASIKARASIAGSSSDMPSTSRASMDPSRMSMASRAARMSVLSWVDFEERKDLVQERLARARFDKARRAKSFSKGLDKSGVSEVFHDLPIHAKQRRRSMVGGTLMQKPEPGEANLRDVVVDGVGIIYTRARPAGRETVEELRNSANRLKARKARKSLPSEMPPRPPTITGAGQSFADVIKQAQDAQKKGGVASTGGSIGREISEKVASATSFVEDAMGGMGSMFGFGKSPMSRQASGGSGGRERSEGEPSPRTPSGARTRSGQQVSFRDSPPDVESARPVPRGMPRRTPRPSLRPHSNYEPAPPSEPAYVPPAPVPARAPAATSMQRAGSALRSAMARRRPGGTSQSDTRNLGV